MPKPGDIIGLHGCECHPFKSWKECNFYHNHKLKVGDMVKDRCNKGESRIGTITIVFEQKGYYQVKFGKNKNDLKQRHAAELIKL